MSCLNTSLQSTLKSTICSKVSVEHFVRTIYSPECISYCSELCGRKCLKRCNKTHTGGCNPGELPDKFAFCPSSNNISTSIFLEYITYDKVTIDNGKGKTFERVEKVTSNLDLEEFKKRYKEDFSSYSKHTLSYWFLRATKIEVFIPAEGQLSTATCISDFGEAIVIIDKREVSDSFYHRREVINL